MGSVAISTGGRSSAARAEAFAFIFPPSIRSRRRAGCAYFFGKGDDAGWMMIKATDTGGRTVSTATGGSKAKFIQFSTLPFLPKGVKFADRELEIATAGADMTTVKVRLPWVSKEGRTIAQQLWDAQDKAA